MKLRLSLFSLLFTALLSTGLWAQMPKNVKRSNDTTLNRHMLFESNLGDSIVHMNGYSVIFNYRYRLPNYVFNQLTVDQLVSDESRPPVKRSNSFYPYQLPNGSSSATNSDYSKTGYDRGHMVPAGDFVWNRELKDETFYHININPQKPGLNRGIWANLEARIRDRVMRDREDAHVVTGVIFSPECREKIGTRGMCVPVSFFKLVYFPKSNRMYAFLFDNTVDSFQGDIRDFQISVDLIEQITGEDFFDLLDVGLQAKLESVILRFDD